MANTQTTFHPDHSSHITYIQHPQPNNNFVQQPSFNRNYMPQPMQNPEDILDPTTAMNMTLALLAKAFKVNTIPTNNNQRSSLIPHNTPAEGNGNGIHDAHEETERVKVSCTLEDTFQQASTSGTQTDNAPVYDTGGSAEVHLSKNYYDNDIFNMFTQEEQYTKLLEPIPKQHQVPQNVSNVIYDVSSVEQGGGIVEQHSVNVEETHA
nr:hypothetical protein [Tanacetum cinerariifolium]